MDDIVRQVSRAQRRLNLEQFVRLLPWTLFAALVVACLALAIPKVWVMPWAADDAVWQTWLVSWLGGAVLVGFLAAGIWTYAVRRRTFEAAFEVDRRFGLKERVASSLALSADERASQMGRALV